VSVRTARVGGLTLESAPDPLTPVEAAVVMRCGVNSIYTEIRRGRLYATKIGRSLRIPKSALARLLDPPDGDLPRCG